MVNCLKMNHQLSTRNTTDARNDDIVCLINWGARNDIDCTDMIELKYLLSSVDFHFALREAF
jgi:hypothetical protein